MRQLKDEATLCARNGPHTRYGERWTGALLAYVPPLGAAQANTAGTYGTAATETRDERAARGSEVTTTEVAESLPQPDTVAASATAAATAPTARARDLR